MVIPVPVLLPSSPSLLDSQKVDWLVQLKPSTTGPAHLSDPAHFPAVTLAFHSLFPPSPAGGHWGLGTVLLWKSVHIVWQARVLLSDGNTPRSGTVGSQGIHLFNVVVGILFLQVSR